MSLGRARLCEEKGKVWFRITKKTLLRNFLFLLLLLRFKSQATVRQICSSLSLSLSLSQGGRFVFRWKIDAAKVAHLVNRKSFDLAWSKIYRPDREWMDGRGPRYLNPKKLGWDALAQLKCTHMTYFVLETIFHQKKSIKLSLALINSTYVKWTWLQLISFTISNHFCIIELFLLFFN